MRRYILASLLVFMSVFTFGFDSPAPGGKILSAFAKDNHGRFNTGQEIQSRDVCASEDGEIVYYGNGMIAIQHTDGIMSIYTGVDVLKRAVFSNFVKKGQLIGSAVEGSFYFEILDTELSRYINPSLMIWRVKKSELPAVLDIEYNSVYRTLDVRLDNSRMEGLYSIQVLLDGVQVYDLRFETISVSDGHLKLDGTGFTCADLYRERGMFSFAGVPFKEGDNPVEIIVKDFYGKTVSFRGNIGI